MRVSGQKLFDRKLKIKSMSIRTEYVEIIIKHILWFIKVDGARLIVQSILYFLRSFRNHCNNFGG